MPPPQSSSSSSRRERRHHQDTVPPVVTIWTGASISFPEGLANTPSSCLASSTLLPGSQRCSSDHPVPPSGSRRKNMANANSLLQSKAVENITSRSLSRPSTPGWVLSGLAPVQTALVPVLDSNEGSADAPALVFAGVQLETPALVSAGGQLEAPAPVSTGGQPDISVPASVPPLLQVLPPTSPSSSAISDGAADTPASVSDGVQQDAPPFISARGQPDAPVPVAAEGQPDISEPASLPPDQPPFTST
ncbi:hypothetical protein ILYODFUR_031782 [Ilyodon furcidens]|uniref:Uncharacterized protein n=1 Tax=Ilyodon furcidens TaxID=33524 RepID=A0ABV0UE83_9TELE